MLNLYLIRHAESEAQKQPHIVCGRSNEVPLTRLGEFQAEGLGKRLAKEGVKFDYVYSSVAERAKETAKIAIESMETNNEIQLREECLEQSQGDWEGQPRSEVMSKEVKDQMHWGYRPPNGESKEDVAERMHNWIEKEIMPMCAEGKNVNVAVFTHQWAIKCFLQKIYGTETTTANAMIVDNTSVTHLQFNPKWRSAKVNDSEHLYVLGLKIKR